MNKYNKVRELNKNSFGFVRFKLVLSSTVFVKNRHKKAVYDNYPPTTTKLPPFLFEVAVGNRLGDRSLYTTKTKGSKMKLEQGAVHKDYLFELFELYREWTTYKTPYEYIPSHTRGTYTAGVVKSYSFRTITHPAFNRVYDLFMVNGKKCYKEGTITNHLSSVGLSYWIRDDGSLQKNNEVILRTMGFTKEENIQMVKELNMKFKLHRKVVKAKNHFAIYIPASDAPVLRKHLVYLPDSMKYKMPVVKDGKPGPKPVIKTSNNKFFFNIQSV